MTRGSWRKNGSALGGFKGRVGFLGKRDPHIDVLVLGGSITAMRAVLQRSVTWPPIC